MSKRGYVVVGLIWVLSLVLVGVVAAGQARMYRPLPEPKVMSGEDVGFRVEGMYGEQPTGTIVIRVNGRWIEVGLGAGLARPGATN